MPEHAPPGHDPQTFEIIGAAMDVHKELGCGFLERVYREPFAFELTNRGVPFERERTFRVRYKGRVMPSHYVVDFLCFGEVVVELKALAALSPVDHAQAINYLRVSGLRRALLINFGARSLEFKRVVWDDPDARTRARPTTSV